MIELATAVGRDVPRETVERLEHYAALVRAENERQNLVARSTLDALWDRHIVDSAQLVRYGNSTGSWLDIGSGAGLPGLVIACLISGPVTLVEPRRLRAEFLQRAGETLGLLDRISVLQAKAEAVTGKFDVITGRAVANLSQFLGISRHLAHDRSVWLLPKGRTALEEVEVASRRWHYAAKTMPSVTDPEAAILVIQQVRQRN